MIVIEYNDEVVSFFYNIDSKLDYIRAPKSAFKQDIEDGEYTGESMDISSLKKEQKQSIIDKVFVLFQYDV